MLASTAFVACTNDEDPVNNEQVVANGEKSYVAVNIVTPGSVNGRATFEPGTPDEVKVKDAIFLFLDGNYNGCAQPYYTTSFTWGGDANGEGQDKQKTVLVVDGKKDEVPAYILAILNPINKNQFTANTSLQNVKDFYAQFANQTDYLVMSNAVYADTNGKEVAATPITLANISDSQAEAMQNPVTIQVERVVGKVIVNKLDDAIANLNKTGLTDKIDDQEEMKLKFVLTGWEVLQNVGSYQIKNIDATKWTITNWNDLNLKRSYWANDFTGKGRTSYDVTKMSNTAFKYVEETVNQAPQAKNHKDMVSPYVLVSGKFVDAATDKAVDLVEWRGQKYTKEGYLNFIAGNPEISQYYTATTTGEGDAAVTTYTSFSADLLKLADNKDNDWGATAVLKDESTKFYTVEFDGDGKTIKKGSAKEAGAGVVKAAIAKFGEVQYWNGGNTYYYTPILHQTDYTTNQTENNYYGVVRNHAYKINITKIQGYGTPVAEPKQFIDQPEKPNEGSTFLAAEIVVLDWRVISNDVTLQ